MNKKIIGIIVGIIVIALLAVGGFILLNNNDQKQAPNEPETKEPNNDNQDSGNDDTNSNLELGKVLVVYYSATSNTKTVAEILAQKLNGDLFEIVPEKEYTSEDLNYGNPNSRVSKEHNDESLRDVALKTTTVENWNQYDTVLIGYPIWWGIAAWPTDSFVKANDFSGKTVIPFCTSASSGLGESGELLKSIAKGGEWKTGYRFNSRPTDTEIDTFINQIK